MTSSIRQTRATSKWFAAHTKTATVEGKETIIVDLDSDSSEEEQTVNEIVAQVEEETKFLLPPKRRKISVVFDDNSDNDNISTTSTVTSVPMLTHSQPSQPPARTHEDEEEREEEEEDEDLYDSDDDEDGEESLGVSDEEGNEDGELCELVDHNSPSDDYLLFDEDELTSEEDYEESVSSSEREVIEWVNTVYREKTEPKGTKEREYLVKYLGSNKLHSSTEKKLSSDRYWELHEYATRLYYKLGIHLLSCQFNDQTGEVEFRICETCKTLHGLPGRKKADCWATSIIKVASKLPIPNRAVFWLHHKVDTGRCDVCYFPNGRQFKHPIIDGGVVCLTCFNHLEKALKVSCYITICAKCGTERRKPTKACHMCKQLEHWMPDPSPPPNCQHNQHTNPRKLWFMLENVRSMADVWKQCISKGLHVQPKQLCASQFGCLFRKNRYFWTNLAVPDAPEDVVPPSYQQLLDNKYGPGRYESLASGKVPMFLKGKSDKSLHKKDAATGELLHVTVAEAMQGYQIEDSYFHIGSKDIPTAVQREFLGNSFIPVVVKHVLTNIKKSNRPLVVISLFDGCAMALVALKLLGKPVEAYYSSEINPHANQFLSSRYGRSIIHLGNVQSLTENHLAQIVELHSDADVLLIGGSPCANLSSVNMTTRFGLLGEQSILFFDYLKIQIFLKQYIEDNQTSKKFVPVKNLIKKLVPDNAETEDSWRAYKKRKNRFVYTEQN